jgi:hypothetical protein
MKVNLALASEDVLTPRVSMNLSLLEARKSPGDLFNTRKYDCWGETHNVKHVNPAKGSMPLRELFA